MADVHTNQPAQMDIIVQAEEQENSEFHRVHVTIMLCPHGSACGMSPLETEDKRTGASRTEDGSPVAMIAA